MGLSFLQSQPSERFSLRQPENVSLSSRIFFLFLTFFVFLSSDFVHAGATLKGLITYGGETPTKRHINMWLDQNCQKQYEGKPKPVADVLVLGPEKQVANVMVRITSGLDPGLSFPIPKESVTLEQKGCLYQPKIAVVRKGQPFRIVNADPTTHTVQGRAVKNGAFNFRMKPGAPVETKIFNEAEGPFSVECTLHPWMQSFVTVIEHPFFAVTGLDGQFEIKDIPPGKYQVEIWHAKLGVLSIAVNLSEGETKTLDYVLKKARRKVTPSPLSTEPVQAVIETRTDNGSIQSDNSVSSDNAAKPN